MQKQAVNMIFLVIQNIEKNYLTMKLETVAECFIFKLGLELDNEAGR